MSLTQKLWKEKQVPPLTQEKAVDLYNRNDGRRTHVDPFKYKSLSLHELFLTGHQPSIVVSITIIKSNVRTVLTTWNTTKNNCIM